MQTDNQLIRSYLEDRSEGAFTEFVQRHIINLVYSAALREARGNAALAEDIAQLVFTELARKAARLIEHPALAGWLYTCAINSTALCSPTRAALITGRNHNSGVDGPLR